MRYSRSGADIGAILGSRPAPERSGAAYGDPSRGGSIARGLRLGDDDHPAWALRQHRLQASSRTGGRRFGSAAASTIAAALIARASSAIAWPAWPGRTRSTWPVTRRPPISFACSILLCASLSSRLERRVERQVGGDRDQREDVDPAAAARGEPTAVATASSENGSSSNATSTLWYSTSSTPSGSGVHHLDRLRERQPLVAPVEEVDRDPDQHPRRADHERPRVERHHDDPGGERPEPAENRGQRQLDARRPGS